MHTVSVGLSFNPSRYLHDCHSNEPTRYNSDSENNNNNINSGNGNDNDGTHKKKKQKRSISEWCELLLINLKPVNQENRILRWLLFTLKPRKTKIGIKVGGLRLYNVHHCHLCIYICWCSHNQSNASHLRVIRADFCLFEHSTTQILHWNSIRMRVGQMCLRFKFAG